LKLIWELHEKKKLSNQNQRWQEHIPPKRKNPKKFRNEEIERRNGKKFKKLSFTIIETSSSSCSSEFCFLLGEFGQYLAGFYFFVIEMNSNWNSIEGYYFNSSSFQSQNNKVDQHEQFGNQTLSNVCKINKSKNAMKPIKELTK
jgi:hypothetical protein